MTLDLKLVLKAGIVWGIIGILIIVAVTLLSGILPFSVDGFSVGLVAALFAGVHFAYRNQSNFVVDVIGGAISGIIAALLLVAASLVLPMVLGTSAGGGLDPQTIVTALLAGIGGGLGMLVVKAIK